MKKITILLVLSALLIGCSGSTGTVKIGVIAPLTGENAQLGEGARNAALLAMEDLGNTTLEYELIFEDDKLQPKETSNAINKLVRADRVDAVISLSSGSGNVVSPVTEENKVIHFGVASDKNIATGEYNFIHWTPPETEAELWVKEAEKRGVKNFSLIALNQQGVKAFYNALREELRSSDIEIIEESWVNFGDKDFRTIILKMEEHNPEIYMIQAFSPELENLGKQFRELGINKTITTIEYFDVSAEPELFNGNWYVSGAKETKGYTDSYAEKYNKKPIVTSANVYDSVQMIVAGFERAAADGTYTKEEVLDEINNIDGFEGALGTLTVGEGGIVDSPASVKKIEDGEPVFLS